MEFIETVIRLTKKLSSNFISPDSIKNLTIITEIIFQSKKSINFHRDFSYLEDRRRNFQPTFFVQKFLLVYF